MPSPLFAPARPGPLWGGLVAPEEVEAGPSALDTLQSIFSPGSLRRAWEGSAAERGLQRALDTAAYYAGPHLTDRAQALATVAPRVDPEPMQRAAEAFRAGNYGTAAGATALGTAGGLLDVLPGEAELKGLFKGLTKGAEYLSPTLGMAAVPMAAAKAEKVKLIPGSPGQKAEAAASVNAKNAATATDPRWIPPDLPEFWPWQVEAGPYRLGQDLKKGEKYFPERVKSASEEELAKALKQAEAEVKAGKGVEQIFGPNDIYQQPLRNMTLPMELRTADGRGKGVPPHVYQNVAPGSGAEDRLFESAVRGEAARPWYYTGRYLDDLIAAHGPQAGLARMDRFGGYMGATTSDATPAANVRMATYQMALNDQQRAAQAARGIGGNGGPPLPVPVPVNPQYPYGHARYSTTHRPALESLASGEPDLNSIWNPKGAEFSGSISGKSSGAVMDRVMMEDVLQARNAAGKLIAAPEPGTYPVYRDWMRDQASSPRFTARFGHRLRPDELQAMSWAGHNPDKVAQYSKPLLGHMNDRINVTAKVMSAKAGREVSPWEVYYRHVVENMPLLTVPIAGAGIWSGLMPDEGR